MDMYLNSSDDDQLLITVRGETDPASAGTLFLRLVVLAGAATGQVAIGLPQVTVVDCTELRAPDAIDRHVRASGGSVRVAAVSPAVARLLELGGPHGSLPRIFAPPAPSSQHRAAAPLPHTPRRRVIAHKRPHTVR
ncbi:MAG TPA: STAS domain-containing protein [Actinocrinis sp.]|jgi:anti-anti-sigma regulatory factor|uniref:STAS domain-containing protein n=1 Tax=Actinocrinis sp. TaxID=1920516 RepID=UPI002DDD05BE|nr:STAS domain-containing protein [Actinocrinis sp.]HEV3169294.1 STAS domain-containing protein [Actinocrinis sp.]